ncbi:MAG: phytoene/squalene synthase family protein [Candidatus Diapherotrites archaeon]|uniref:Phytoene/squalene synthase family protein n=1 Tax=Candidatus Iainarchaeum sp. TaxID=3101447 RepID=A0A8T4C5X8_9ARCH|nr:phytoene/squalene synthase family protein [Candidatus Diapherotrites archaeon]
MSVLHVVDYSHSEKMCRKHATSFSLAAEYLPERERLAAYATYGFCRVTDQIIDGNDSVPEKKKRLDEWKNNLTQTWNHGTSSDPILHAFIQTCQQYDIPPEWGFRLIEGLKKDLEKNTYDNFDELYEYCFSAAAIPGLLMAYVLRAPHSALEHAIELGIAMQLTNILRDVKEDLDAGRVYLPQDEMKKFNYTREQLARHEKNDSFSQMMAFNIARARDYYTKSDEGISHLPEDARLGMRLCAVFYREILSEIEKREYDVFTQRVYVSDERKKELLMKEKDLLTTRIKTK